MELFDIVKLITSKNNNWSKVTNNEKSRNFFMINRIMSIKFPVWANQFNKTKINPIPVVNWWYNTLSQNYTRTPDWIYTKTLKKEKALKEAVYEDAEKFVRERMAISKRELSELKQFYPEKYNKWIKSIDQQIKVRT